MSTRSDESSGHSGHAHGADTDGATWKLVLSIVLNLAITVAEFVAGMVAGSLALMADAAHNLNDAGSLGVSLYARRIAGRAPDPRRTFGYRRAEVVGAFVNLVTLVLIAVYLLTEAVQRFADPRTVDGELMVVVASVALVANVGTALLLYRSSRGSLNIRSAFVHIVADAMASVAVIVGGILVSGWGLYVVDSVLTGGISVYILVQSYWMLRRTIRILMNSAPPGFDIEELVGAMEAIENVEDVHHVHVWQLDERRTACEAHVVVSHRDLAEIEAVKSAIKKRLTESFGIEHTTLEFEFDACEGEQLRVVPRR